MTPFTWRSKMADRSLMSTRSLERGARRCAPA